MKARIIACPNCYKGFSWDGKLEDFKCPNCKRVIPMSQMAISLIHLFCAPSIREQRYAYEFMKFLTEHGWENAMYIGRHDWVIARCPIDVDEISNIVQYGDEIELTGLSRLLSQQSLPPFLVESGKNKIGLAGVSRLKSGELNYLLRERIYYILKHFPVKEGKDVLKNLKKDYPDEDGDEETLTGSALQEALEQCRGENNNEL